MSLNNNAESRKRIRAIAIAGFAVAMSALTSCGNRAELETCTILEIEDAEFEVDVGDIDIERGEVEMICEEEVVDVTWGQFREELRIDPGNYKTNLEQFKREVSCVKNARDDKEVLCKTQSSSEFVPLRFSYDD